MDFKPATLEQRKQFYKKFRPDRDWFRQFPQLIAFDLGTETGITTNPAKEGKLINMKAVDIKNKLLKYLPEDVYYDRNQYKKPDVMLKSLDFKGVWKTENLLGQELAFDIDPENIECSCSRICGKCMRKTVSKAIGLSDFLKQNFNRIRFVYSGRGMHVHVLDNSAFKLSVKERTELNKECMQFSIDPWVSKGFIRLIRLPYSLNAAVSRIVMPINNIDDFDPVTSGKVVPDFVKLS